MQTQAISEFWSWFASHETSLRAMAGSDDPLWDTALARLRAVHASLAFELSDPVEGVREFVVTAQGNAELFPLVDAMIAAASPRVGWEFVALKPAMGFDFITTYEGVKLDPREMWFMPLTSSSRPADLGVRIAVPGYTPALRSMLENALMMIVDTGIGERSAAMDIQHVDIEAVPEEPAKRGYIELTDLGPYIAWHKRRVAGNA
jgi:hypothetical protein